MKHPTIAINKAHFPITTLGFGRRVGIWMQGCSIHCPGCVNKDTWEFDRRREIEVDVFLNALAPWLEKADGITVSGGEPFDQPAALLELIRELRRRRSGDILVYSGYSREVLREKHERILELIDVLISDPYEAAAGQHRNLRGSDNQRVWLLTSLARERYPETLDSDLWPARRRMDLFMDAEEVWMAGIPRPGDLERLRREMQKSGFVCRSSRAEPKAYA
jgi:anaerobic ribonucleoside-triphosphate reductase activating protein